jgi:hypothetical protein
MGFQMAGSLYPRKRRTNSTSSAPKAPKAPVTLNVPAAFEDAHKKLMAYNETFPFLLDIRHKLIKYGQLSDSQWHAVVKCLTKPNAPNVAEILVEKCHVRVQITAVAARIIAKANNWPINPCTLAITQIKSKTNKGITVKAVIDWSGNVGVCRCCNKTLTDWRSQATGVGPICVKGTGFPYVRSQADVTRFQNDMQDLCKKLGEVEFFLKNWSIVAGGPDLDAVIRVSTPTKVNTNDALVYPLRRFDWDQTTRILWADTRYLYDHQWKFADVMPEAIGVHNPATNITVKFIKGATMSSNLPGCKAKVSYYSIDIDKPITVILEVGVNDGLTQS